MSKRFFTTAIPYVNARPHVGHALEFVQTDALARYYRLYGDEVFFLTGTDENSLKNVHAAEKEGIPVATLVERNAAVYKKLADDLNVAYDDFIRTTEKRHIKGVNKLWKAASHAMYQKAYKGLYCVGCEEFYKEDELVNGLCPEHQKKLEVVSETNYFFKLTDYAAELKKLIASDRIKILPPNRKNEMLSFMESGLEDFCISRSAERAKGWGIPVPNDESQVIWVWFDALSNYINAIGYPEGSLRFAEWWEKSPHVIHVIGKGILRFHSIYWPAMLLASSVSPPKQIYVHDYITVEGQKMSKTLGNVIDPFEVLAWRGVDPLRWYFLREIPTDDDGDFSKARFEVLYDSELANNLGNLVSRVFAMVIKYFDGKIPEEKIDGGVKVRLEATWKAYREGFENFLMKKSCESVLGFLDFLNQYVDTKKPWKLVKEGKQEELAFTLFNLLEGIRQVSVLLAPIMPETAEKIAKALGSRVETYAKNLGFGSGLMVGQTITQPTPLFPKQIIESEK